MAYEVLARKWRPKNFSELVGQDSVRQTLINGLKQNRIYPVLLFTGPRGTGKTSSARILAKNLRCQNQKDFIPCDQCEDCRFIQESRHLDVIEIDGASNNGVEAVRELRDTVAYMPSTGSRKIYIIDEVHMLSNSAFNALLKTFEEPPQHILFIMATTEIRKIPPTVLSRAQRLDFHTLSHSNIKKQLEVICQREKWAISEDLLWIIAKQARGSLRDGQSLLDQIITFCGKDFNKKEALKLLGLSDPEVLFQCLQALIHRKERPMIELIESLRAKGISPRLFLQGLIEALSQLLFLKKNPGNQPELVQAGEAEIEQMKKEIKNISYEDLHFLFDMLLKGERDMAFCHDSQLALEVLLLRLCGAPRLESITPFNPLILETEQKEGEVLKAPPLKKTQKQDIKEAAVQPRGTQKQDIKDQKRDIKDRVAQPKGTQKLDLKNSTAQPKETTKRDLKDSTVQDKNQKLDLKDKAAPPKKAPHPDLKGPTEPKAPKKIPQPDLKDSLPSPKKTAKKSSHPDLKEQTEGTAQLQALKKSSHSGLKEQTELENNSLFSLSPQTEEQKTTQKNKEEPESFELRFDFLKFLKEKDQNLSALAEFMSIKKKSPRFFYFAMPEKFSYLKNKITNPSVHRLLEDYLTEFLNSKERVEIEFLNNNNSASLKEEKKAIEKDQLLTKVQEDSFVNKLKDIFGGEIKSVTKKTQ